MPRVAFIGLGRMGHGMAGRYLEAGFTVAVWNRSKAKAEELGLEWLVEIGAHGVVAGPDSSLQHQPSNAIKKACEKQGITPGDLDLLEINEAFAAVGLASLASVVYLLALGTIGMLGARRRLAQLRVRVPGIEDGAVGGQGAEADAPGVRGG